MADRTCRKKATRRALLLGGVLSLGVLGAPWAVGHADRGNVSQVQAGELVLSLVVPGDAGWVDTGVDVAAGESLLIKASGIVSLQAGNPAGDCGPGGLDVVTVQQPLPEVNLGALIGKISQIVAVREVADRGEAVRDEVLFLFPVGEETTVTAPLRGRLYLGINENVLKDNSGAFSVQVVKLPR